MLKSRFFLLQYDAYILDKGSITLVNTAAADANNANLKQIFKN